LSPGSRTPEFLVGGQVISVMTTCSGSLRPVGCWLLTFATDSTGETRDQV
jgi:hypothetical protein